MKNKTLLSAFMLLLFVFSGYAQVQKAQISFKKSLHQFGVVKEESGDLDMEFEFTNIGNSPLVLEKVTAEKGIDVTSWPKDAIAPGEKGMIKAVFHPKGNPTRIYKKINVYSNAKKKMSTLSVVGNVTPIPGSMADKYRKSLGDNLRLKSTYVVFGKVSNKDEKTYEIEMINSGEEDMKISFRNIPKHIKVSSSASLLKPKQEAVLTIVYNAGLNINADGSQKWGEQRDRFYVVINDDTHGSGRNSIAVNASITEDFNSMSAEELAKAPNIKFENTVFNFGTIKQGDKVEHDFKFTNTGENDLEIRHVKAT